MPAVAVQQPGQLSPLRRLQQARPTVLPGAQEKAREFGMIDGAVRGGEATAEQGEASGRRPGDAPGIEIHRLGRDTVSGKVVQDPGQIGST